MENLIFRHMQTVRELTLKCLDDMPEEIAGTVPDGYPNHIHWNFGHILFIQERLALEVAGEEMELPEEYRIYFAAGTRPSEWKGAPPTLIDIREALDTQTERLRKLRAGRLDEPLPEPFTNRMGLAFRMAGETLLFSFYHEALHLETVRQMRKMIEAGQ
ncbi:DinB family protein [Bhargavaea beijingensis]|uniref:DinB superfamily protein n=1 Tax=Bhargavaea beijingensis TaxID=426756 RepID=A0A1G7F7K5_9BACL|nr:DinB family protein [Bhargavaea beijingensis]MCW1927669.1 DinB family protein [Bhargavaea beijingensis]SDE71841.1 DinB superfamily protein [Bhargavaea beijingensis]